MKFNQVLLLSAAAVLCILPAIISAAYLPKDLDNGLGDLRAKRELPQLKGGGSEKAGTIGISHQGTLFEDKNGKLDGSVAGQTAWQKGFKPQHSATVGVNGERNLFDSGKTRVFGTGGVQGDYGTGVKPHYSGSAGLGVSHQISKNVEVFGGAQRTWGSLDKYNFGGGIRGRF